MAPITGMPGIKTSKTYTPRDVLLTSNGAVISPSNMVIQGSVARDPDNTGNIDVLRPGMILADQQNAGRLLTTPIIGVTTADYTTGTSLTVTSQCATELSRRYDTTGVNDFVICGSTQDSGEEEVEPLMEAIDHSAIDTSTGVLTVTALSLDYKAGSLILASEAVRSIAEVTLMDCYILLDHVKVTDDAGTSLNAPLARNLVGGVVNIANLINYPGNWNMRQWVNRELRNNKIGLAFSFEN